MRRCCLARPRSLPLSLSLSLSLSDSTGPLYHAVENKLPPMPHAAVVVCEPPLRNGRVNTAVQSGHVTNQKLTIGLFLSSILKLRKKRTWTFHHHPSAVPLFSLDHWGTICTIIRLHASRMYVHVHLNYYTTRVPQQFNRQTIFCLRLFSPRYNNQYEIRQTMRFGG